MSSLFSTAGLARASARRPWAVVGAWIAVFILAIGVTGLWLSDALTTEINFTNEQESVRGLDLMHDAGIRESDPVTETVVIRSEDVTVDDPAFQAVVESTTAELRAMQESGVVDAAPESVVNYYEASAAGLPMAEALVSEDRQTTIIPVTLAGSVGDAGRHAAEYVENVTSHGNGFQVLTVGETSINHEFGEIAEADLRRGESVGLGLGMIILVIVFGALVAAGVPVVLAIVSITVALGLTSVLGQFVELSFFIQNMIVMIGLAVGIDYALFVVARYREERRHGRPKLDAIELTGGTASKAVLFSGGTVVLALMGMFLVPTTIFRSLGAGAILVVIVAVLANLTLIPAILSLLGDRIDWPRRRRYDAATVQAQAAYDRETIHAGFWGRITRTVMGRPVVAVVLAVALLLTAASPLLDLDTGFAGVETLPESDVRSAFEILSRDFSAGMLAPVEIVVDSPRSEVEGNIENLVSAVGADPAFNPVNSPVVWSENEQVGLVTAMFAVSADSEAAFEAIERLRGEIIPEAFGSAQATNVYVTGSTAFNVDFFQLAEDYTPWVFVFVLGMSFVLLMLAFRSIVVPAKAIVMNLLSVGAAYGLLVLVFQRGVGADFFGFQQTPTIEAWIPIFLFSVLFGLSMDYHVFLLSRIREHYDLTGNNRESVAVGLQSTAKIITGAALIMIAVFSGFAAGRLVMLQQVGFGLAVAVLIDVTVIRSVLVPASMALLGRWNWYLPSWLTWLPDLRVEGAPTHAPIPGHVPVPEGAGD